MRGYLLRTHRIALMSSLLQSDIRRQRLTDALRASLKWALRPVLLLIISLTFVVVAAVLMYSTPVSEARSEPRPVRAGDREIVFLYQATGGATWQRFVKAAEHLHGWRDFEVDSRNAFPPQTTAVSELIVSSRSAKGRLVFRWYKLTGTQRVGDWV